MTVAFGTTAPEESVILPVNAPVEDVCAKTDGAIAKNEQRRMNRKFLQAFAKHFDILVDPPYCGFGDLMGAVVIT